MLESIAQSLEVHLDNGTGAATVPFESTLLPIGVGFP